MRGAIGLLVAAVLVTACAPDPAGATPVMTSVADDRIILETNQVAQGRVVFEIENRSDRLVHEVEVFSGATIGVVLPMSSSVADTSGLTLVDEVEEIVPRSNATLTIDLAPDTYLVICNLPGHYANGMWAYLTVTGS